ncbi:MAG: hypothetical protein JXL97_17075 [Bacteroidales bacterium]|nr:hypothetical protein [Bacteroidales bacterium]
MEIKEQISIELNSLPPEILDQLYNFMQFIKKSYKDSSQNKNKQEHFLSKFAGIIDDKSAEEIKNIVNSEFQNIEGEW